MNTLRSWRALFVREYLEHRIAFFYFPLGIVVILLLSAASAFSFNRVKFASSGFMVPPGLKLFEIGYLLLLALWFAYMAVTLFFYFGDAFSADRRNNAMFFWKSMPVSDLRMVASKFLAGTTMFPAIILVVGTITGLIFLAIVGIAPMVFPNMLPPDPMQALQSFVQITAFGIVYVVLAMLWYAPFLAWVGGLSTVFGRWSLPLAFVIPGLIAVVENIALFGHGPRGGYVWSYITHRWQFGLSDQDYGFLVMNPLPFSATDYIGRLFAEIDWVALVTGLVFAAVVMWLASEYRRRRIN